MSFYYERETGAVQELIHNIFIENKESTFGSDDMLFELSTASENFMMEFNPKMLENYSNQNSMENYQNLPSQPHEQLQTSNSEIRQENSLNLTNEEEDRSAIASMTSGNNCNNGNNGNNPQCPTICAEGTEYIENSEFNLGNERKSEKKGKSNPLPEEVSSIYTKLKEYYSELPGMFRLDGIRKKQKTHFFKWIKRLLDQKIAKIPGYKKTQFKKLNQKCIAKADLKFNSGLFKKTVCEVYFDDSVENNNLMQVLINNYNNEECDTLMLFLDTPLYQVYDLYLESPEFKSDFKKIERKTYKEADDSDPQEKQYILLYLEVYRILSREFVNYYMSTVPNQRTSLTNRRPNRDRQVLNNVTDSEQRNSGSTREGTYSMSGSESCESEHY